jgi:hypothetical protein
MNEGARIVVLWKCFLTCLTFVRVKLLVAGRTEHLFNRVH